MELLLFSVVSKTTRVDDRRLLNTFNLNLVSFMILSNSFFSSFIVLLAFRLCSIIFVVCPVGKDSIGVKIFIGL